MTASAMSLWPAPNPARDNNIRITKVWMTILEIMSTGSFDQALWSQSFQPACAVADAFLINSEHIEDAQQKIPSWNRLRCVGQVASSLELPGCAAGQDVRHVVVLMLIRITHVGAVEGYRMIE